VLFASKLFTYLFYVT